MVALKNISSLAERLKYLRRVKELSQGDLAKIAETTQQAIQQAESGKAQNPRYLHKIALALDVPYEWLTMNILPEKDGPKAHGRGFSERGRDVLDSFYGMPKKDQALVLELMKSRRKKDG